MRKITLVLVLGCVFIGGSVFAADGDLIVNGKVGIGTASPSYKLHIEGGDIFTNGSVGYFASGGYPGLWLDESDGLQPKGAFLVLEGGVVHLQRRSTNFGGFEDSPFYLNINAPTGTISADHLGKVGFGTLFPGGRLHAVNPGSITDFFMGDLASGKTFGYLRTSADANGYVEIGSVKASGTAYGDLILNLNGGNVGLGTADPGTHKLYVNGTVYSTGGYQPSDSRYKVNIAAIESALDKVLRIQGITFNWKMEEYVEESKEAWFPPVKRTMGFPAGKHYGVAAEAVQAVLPEVVAEGPDEMKAVAYTELIPILIEAIKEQQREIVKLKEDLEALKK